MHKLKNWDSTKITQEVRKKFFVLYELLKYKYVRTIWKHQQPHTSISLRISQLLYSKGNMRKINYQKFLLLGTATQPDPLYYGPETIVNLCKKQLDNAPSHRCGIKGQFIERPQNFHSKGLCLNFTFINRPFNAPFFLWLFVGLFLIKYFFLVCVS